MSPDGQRFAPAIVGWLDGDLPVLVTEDLTGAYWPAGTGTVHWRAGDMQAVLAELRLLRAVPAGGRLVPRLADKSGTARRHPATCGSRSAGAAAGILPEAEVRGAR